jgi:8-oxo-dGTP pyrophosphatase MutT (NUDIX family)
MSLLQSITTALENAPKRPDDYYFSDMRASAIDAVQLRKAAVLIAITDREDPGVILTTRPQWLNRHAGQVAFPGGRVDPGDVSIEAAALREAEEEIALPRSAVQIAGRSISFCSGSGFDITPVVAVIPANLTLRPDPNEVDQIFEAPLSLLLNPSNFTMQRAEWMGQMREYHELYWGGFHIWGITAAILLNLSLQLDGQLPLETRQGRSSAIC